MYTRCPTCFTCFRVTAQHLSIADGQVRCGQCQLVFNAPEHAIDDLPIQQDSSTEVMQKQPIIENTEEVSVSKNTEADETSNVDDTMAIIDRQLEEESETQEFNFELDFDLDSPLNKTPDTDDLVDIINDSPEEEDTSQVVFQQVENTEERQSEKNKANEADLNKANSFAVTVDPVEIKHDAINLEKDNNENIPLQLREDFERLKRLTPRRTRPLLNLFFLIILFIFSFSQLAYFRAFELTYALPATIPIIKAFCDKATCRYSGPVATKQIQLLNRDVRIHPKEKNALLISAAIINRAHFAQPYPNIKIRLSDISGNIIAERIFKSKTYLKKTNNPFLLMKSKIPVHINFEVVDPGKDAVNFEFSFL